jgi:hypothetical protein
MNGLGTGNNCGLFRQSLDGSTATQPIHNLPDLTKVGGEKTNIVRDSFN